MAHPRLANSVTDVFELSSHEKKRSWKSAQQEIEERLSREDKRLKGRQQVRGKEADWRMGRRIQEMDDEGDLDGNLDGED